MTCPTTRRYPRTLAEAFPDVRAPAIERPRPIPRFDRIAGVALAIVLGVFVGALLAWTF